MKRNLRAEMFKANVTTRDIARILDATPKTISNKINGRTEFTWSQICRISEKFFPELDKEYLFAEDDGTA